MSKNISDLFKLVGAPLKNVRWSWGSVSNGGDVFLRVWGDQFRKLDDKTFVRITNYKKREADQGNERLGWNERLEHIDQIRNGANVYCFVCTAKDPNGSPREMVDFDDKSYFAGGSLIEQDGDYWLELRQRIKIKPIKNHSI
jgi:hypothetical protein